MYLVITFVKVYIKQPITENQDINIQNIIKQLKMYD